MTSTHQYTNATESEKLSDGYDVADSFPPESVVVLQGQMLVSSNGSRFFNAFTNGINGTCAIKVFELDGDNWFHLLKQDDVISVGSISRWQTANFRGIRCRALSLQRQPFWLQNLVENQLAKYMPQAAPVTPDPEQKGRKVTVLLPHYQIQFLESIQGRHETCAQAVRRSLDAAIQSIAPSFLPKGA